MHTILLVVHILVAVSLIGLVLIQRGKGAEVGAAFGGGASNTVFGSRGSASFLTRATAVLAALFFIISLSLAFTASQKNDFKSVTELSTPAESTTPAAPATPGVAPPPTGESAPKKPADVPVVPEK
jgi:preprotein translocase subunit SecG